MEVSDVDTPKGEELTYDLVPCNQTLGDLTDTISDDDLAELAQAICADPDGAEMSGSQLHGKQKKIDLTWEQCHGDGCWSLEEQDNWIEDKDLKLVMSRNFVDL